MFQQFSYRRAMRDMRRLALDHLRARLAEPGNPASGNPKAKMKLTDGPGVPR